MFHSFLPAARRFAPFLLLVWVAFGGCDEPAARNTAPETPVAEVAVPETPAAEVAAPEAAAPSSTLAEAATAAAQKPLPKARPGAPTKALSAAGDRPFDKTFDDIKFEMEVGAPFKRSLLTPEIESLVGQQIRIRGFILPTAQKRGLKQFVLVRDNQECCFGPGAALYDCILVEMTPGKTAEFSIRPVAVRGKFSVDEVIGPDGNHWAIYRIDAEEATR